MPTRDDLIKQARRKYLVEQAKNKYQSQQAEEVPEIESEMHPDISFKTRLLYKNLGDPTSDDSFNFLQKQNPDLEFKKGKSGKVMVRGGTSGNKWMYVDPPGFDWQDISDIGYDAAAAVGEGAATVAGGLGGLAAGPVGAAAGAIGAGGAAGAASEGLRQSLARGLGVRQEYDPTSIGISAGMGAASPLLLGTGAGAKAIGKTALRQGLSKEAVAQSQKGLIPRAASGATLKLGQMASGIDAPILKKVRENLPRLAATEKSGTGGAEIFTNVREELEDRLQSRIQQAGKMLGESKQADDIVVDISKAEEPLRDLLENYSNKAQKAIEQFGPEKAAKKKAVQDYNYLKGKLEPYLRESGEIRGSEVADYLNDINEITQISKNINLATKPGVDKDLIRVSRMAAKNVDDQATSSPGGQVYKQFKKEYGELKGIEDNIANKWFKDDVTTERTMNNLLSRKNVSRRNQIQNALNKLDMNIDEETKEAIANSIFLNPSMDITSFGGATSTTRSVPLSAAGGIGGFMAGTQVGEGETNYASGLLGAGIGGFIGGKLASPYALKKYMQAGDVVRGTGRGIQRLTPSPYVPPIQTGAKLWQKAQQEE